MDERRIREIFDECDHDHDGKLTQEELADGLRKLKIPHSKTGLVRFMAVVDVNHDGFLSFAEFHAAALTQQERLKRAFKELDHGGDNAISTKDLERFAERMNITLSHAEVKSLLGMLDRDKSGHVELGEFCEFFLATMGDAHPEGLFEAWLKAAPISALAVPDAPAAEVPSWVTLLSGAVAGMLSRTMTAPADRIKTLLQASDAVRTKTDRLPAPESAARGGGGGAPLSSTAGLGACDHSLAASAAADLTDRQRLREAPALRAATQHPQHGSAASVGTAGQPVRGVSGGGLMSVMSQNSRPSVAPAAAIGHGAGAAPHQIGAAPFGNGVQGLQHAGGGSSFGSGLIRSVGFVPGATHGPIASAVSASGSAQMGALQQSAGHGLASATVWVQSTQQVSSVSMQAAPQRAMRNINLGLVPDWEDCSRYGRSAQASVLTASQSVQAAARSAASTATAAAAEAAIQVHGVRHATSTIFNDGGLRAFWRGNGVNVIKVAPETAVRFWAYERFKVLLCEDPDNISIQERFLSGAAAGTLSQAAIYPLEVAKTRIALSRHGQYRSLGHCVVGTTRTEGFRALYRGLGASLMGIIPYSGVDLALFSVLKEQYHDRWPGDEPGVGTLLLCGACSTTCAQIVSYPLQLVRTRLQAQGMKGRPVVYTGVRDCFSKTVQREGLRGLYRGIGTNFMKSVPAMAISYATYETARRFFMEQVVHRKGGASALFS